MPAMRGSAWISTSDLVRAMPNREPETKAKQSATAMMTAGGNPLPTKQIQQGPAFCPNCGESHRLGNLCTKSLTSALELFLAKGVTMSGNKRGNQAHDSSTGEFTSSSHVATSQTKGEVGGPSERTVARKERAVAKKTAKKTGGKVPEPSAPLPKSPAEQAKAPAAAAPAAKDSPTVPFASKPGEAGPMSSAAATPASPKQDAMESFMGDVAKPTGPTPTAGTPAGIPKSPPSTPTIPESKEFGSAATGPTMQQSAPSATVMGKPGATPSTEPVGAVPQRMSTGHDQPAPMAQMAPDMSGGTMAGHAGAKKKPIGDQPKVGMSPEHLKQRMADFESASAKQRAKQAARDAGIPQPPEPEADVHGPFKHNVGNVAYHQKNQEALSGGASPDDAHAQGLQAGQQAFNERQRGLQAQSGDPVAPQSTPSASPPMTPANQMGPGTQTGQAPAGMVGPSGTQAGHVPAGMVGPSGTQVGPTPTGPNGTQVSPKPSGMPRPKAPPASPSGPTFTPPSTPGQTPAPTPGGKMQPGSGTGDIPLTGALKPWLGYGRGAAIGGGMFTPGGTASPTASAAAQSVHGLLAPGTRTTDAPERNPINTNPSANARSQKTSYLNRLGNYAQGTGSHP